MKKIFILFAVTLFAASFAQTNNRQLKNVGQNRAPSIAFTENRGQVRDQEGHSRPDVLFGAMAGNLAVHIRKTGVSYQLFRADSYKTLMNPGSKSEIKVSDVETIYRIDLSWVECNPQVNASATGELPGYTNYYYENLPGGALEAKSYVSITLKGLYKGVDVHYYEKEGELKHDYIVAAYTDYKQIRMRVDGAEMRVNADGSLDLLTALGTVREGAPIVFQNKQQLKARWQINAGMLGFEIEGYDPGVPLLIDPVTRMWGSYYGGTDSEEAEGSATDAAGNIFMSGYSTTSTGTNIATSGSHQSTHTGGVNWDAFLVKFNPYGVRLWATYYGGAGQDYAYNCATDAANNVYVTGVTTTSIGNVIATNGSHQTVYGGGNADGFLVKFNSSGVRQWGTYYGGTGRDWIVGCAVDPTGDVYIAGDSDTPTGAALATSGCHQGTFAGGANDGVLAKFSSAGVRTWGTYYGGAGDDYGYSCTCDGSGNVYFAGATTSSVSNAIATAASHQPAYGGLNDAYLVKFNGSGVRQWGTYYGGSSSDGGSDCATDAAGNVYLIGGTLSSTGTAIASTGAHQTTFGGGVFQSDGFLAKFDLNGTRLWGTYYGGINNDGGASCATDALGNVYFCGSSNSVNSNAVVTAGSYQTSSSGWYDPILVQFNAAGVRQWGTYYGDVRDDYARSCTIDPAGSVIIAGTTPSVSATNTLASAGSHQPLHGSGYNDVFIVKFDVCTQAPALPSINGPADVCSGSGATYSTAILQGASSFTWSKPPGWTGTGNTNVITFTPSASGIVTLSIGNNCGTSPQQTVNVTVNPNPTVDISSSQNTICVGESAVLTATGATNYTFNPGGPSASIAISPGTTTTYTVTGRDANGCTDVTTFQQEVNACTSLNDVGAKKASSLLIFPNPAQNFVQLELPGPGRIVITSMTGQNVYHEECIAGQAHLDIKQLQKGIYLVRFESSEGVRTGKLVKD